MQGQAYKRPTVVLAISIAACLVGCTPKAALNCVGKIEAERLNSSERAALADALARYGDRCRRPHHQCRVSLARSNHHDILVTVASVYPDPDSRQCLQAPGDQDVAVYRADGTFSHKSLSL